ncbi:MAG: hypothetical protein J7501_15170, partial [Bdellovibrio sp.]|nr:hypothetical protein [Bdellovibrio sp.]
IQVSFAACADTLAINTVDTKIRFFIFNSPYRFEPIDSGLNSDLFRTEDNSISNGRLEKCRNPLNYGDRLIVFVRPSVF